jgi:4-amino-4-deoxy-L-arabinose transferase-like glycosyltransferase
LVVAAARRAWSRRLGKIDEYRAVRFALAATLPPLAILSAAATARHIYLAPALPGVALLLAWWARETPDTPDPWDRRALRATSALLLLGVVVIIAAVGLIGADAWNTMGSHADFIMISAAGLIAATALALRAWTAALTQVPRALWSLLLAYCALLVGPASQVYARVDAWQDLQSIARAIEHDAEGKPLILFAPDETTRAMIDMYARTTVGLIPGPIDAAAIDRLKAAANAAPHSLIVVQLRVQRQIGAEHPREDVSALSWLPASGLRVAKTYSLPHGRRYALLELPP